MKQRIIALCLTLALLLSLGAVTARAEEAPAGKTAEEPADGAALEEGGEAAENETEEDAEAPSPAGPDKEDETPYEPDAVGTISFENLERRMRENNLNLLSLKELTAAVEVVDYDKMYDDLKDQLNSIAKMQWGMLEASHLPEESPYHMPMDSYAYGQLDQAYDALRDTFDDLKDGKLQEDNAGVIRQLKNAQDQVVMAGESLFVALAGMESQQGALQRQLSAMNRTVEELELRYKLGQVSALQLEQAKAGRTSLISGLGTLQMNIETYKTQLELLLGAELTGEIALGAVPEVTAAQLEKMDLEKDLAAAKERSYTVYDADRTLEDAKDTYKDKGKKYGYNESKYEFLAAKHQWQAAQYTHDAAIQNYELSFRTLYAQVGDYKQIFEAAKVSLASQQSSYGASELQFRQGNLSKNKLLDAEDELRAAEDKVRTAAIDLFSAYNTYCWAVEHGILN